MMKQKIDLPAKNNDKKKFLNAISSQWLTARKLNFFVLLFCMICHAEKNLLSLTPMSGHQMHPTAQYTIFYLGIKLFITFTEQA